MGALARRRIGLADGPLGRLGAMLFLSKIFVQNRQEDSHCDGDSSWVLKAGLRLAVRAASHRCKPPEKRLQPKLAALPEITFGIAEWQCKS
jgi:hypothetical protein